MAAKRSLIDELGIDRKILEPKKQQTTKKIEYVRAYVEDWLFVMCANPDIKTITFIDAMCNCGIYQDGDLGTAGEVCRLFVKFGKWHPNIKFYLYLNDKKIERVDCCTEVCCSLIYPSCRNVNIVHANLDVNDFLLEAATTAKVPSGFGNAVLLFVDPYNARTVHLDSLVAFIRSRYCEVLFTWFSSDPRRNQESEAIADCLDGLTIPPGADAGEMVADKLRTGKMKYVFRYAFRTVTNVELYQIIFVTPSARGLEKLKEALWSTFHGAAYHKNMPPQLAGQPTLFSEKDFEKSNAEGYAGDAKIRLFEEFGGMGGVSYQSIQAFVLEQTMLREGQILDLLIKPLVKSGLIKKDGKVSRRNYKGDTYTFVELEKEPNS